MNPPDDPYRLHRFVAAQRDVMPSVEAELRAGRKTSHWMWFVFPQVAGLGSSATARRYAISSVDEARAYLAHPLLGRRLKTCCGLLLDHIGRAPDAMLGSIDALKLRSSMTLFLSVSGDPLFRQVLDSFYRGQRDPATDAIIARWSCIENPSDN